MKNKKLILTIVVIVLIVAALVTAFILLNKKYKWFGKTIDGDKGTSPSGCEGRSSARSSQLGASLWEFEEPYYQGEMFFKKGFRFLGRYIDPEFGRDYVDGYFKGRGFVEIPQSVVDEIKEIPTPVIGISHEWACDSPKYDFQEMPNASEICFTASDLGLNNGDIVPETQRIAYRGEGTKIWKFNRQVGEKFCYVYNPDGNYPTV